MYKSPSHLPEEARVKIAETLNARLADGLALHNDTIAERAVTRGAKAYGTARPVAKASKLPEYQVITEFEKHAWFLRASLEG